MLDINSWMNTYIAAVRAAFGDRVRYVGLQGSRGRGEAGPDSDIDVVCILDACALQDLETYRKAVQDLPDRDKLCGFVSGAAELAAWDPADLFQFRHDTADWYGRLTDLLPPELSTPGPAGCTTCAVTTFSTAGAGRRWRRPTSLRCSCCRPRRTWSKGLTAAGGRTWHSA